MNAYEMLEIVRNNVNEGTAAHWSDKEILRKLNIGHRYAARIVGQSAGDWLVTSTDLTPVSSVITLPSDCQKVVYMEETSSGEEIPFSLTVRNRRVSRGTAGYPGMLEAYLLGNTLEVNQTGYTSGVTLWYQKRVKDLHAGAAGSGSGASTLVLDLDTAPSRVDDYYNDLTVEVVDGTGSGIISEVSDYTGLTYTATITGTCAEDDNYGTVSQLPLEALDLVVYHATKSCMTKPSSAIDPKYWETITEGYRDAKSDLETFLSDRVKGPQYTQYTGIY